MPRKLKTRWHIDDMSAQELRQRMFRMFACSCAMIEYRGLTLAEAWDACDVPDHIEFFLHDLNYTNYRKAQRIAVGRYGEYTGWRSERLKRYKQLIIIKPK